MRFEIWSYASTQILTGFVLILEKYLYLFFFFCFKHVSSFFRIECTSHSNQICFEINGRLLATHQRQKFKIFFLVKCKEKWQLHKTFCSLSLWMSAKNEKKMLISVDAFGEFRREIRQFAACPRTHCLLSLHLFRFFYFYGSFNFLNTFRNVCAKHKLERIILLASLNQKS